MRNGVKILTVVSIVALLMPLMTIGQGGATLDVVRARGQLICGVNSSVPGFGLLDAQTGRFSGFDIDYCRALAVAVFSTEQYQSIAADPLVQFRPVTAQTRFTALAAGEIDVLIRNTTWTFTRDVDLNFNFAPTTFYDGQGFMVRKNSGITSVNDLNGATVCVLQGTTTEQNLVDWAAQNNFTITPLVFAQEAARNQAYDEGRCDALTADASALPAARSLLSNPDDHTVLPERISKEPLGPVVREGDDAWFDLVKWTVYCTIDAEELGVNSGNVAEQLSSNNPEVKRLLGVEGDFGQKLGVANTWCANIIASVGNYGEIYARNAEPLGLARAGSLNELHTRGGAIYAMPFR